MVSDKSTKNSGKDRKLEIVCFNAAYAFEEINKKKPHSFILTSGTLAPLDTFEKEIGLPFKHKLIGTHVINKDQIMISVLKSGLDTSV